MLCPDCHSELPDSPGADVQICFSCQQDKRRRKRTVPKLDPNAAVKIRVDTAHHGTFARQDNDQTESLSFVSNWLGTRPLTHLAVFGLLIFLIGQAIHVWAFLIGNYIAWTTANLITVVGITISIIAIAVTLRNLENRIESLANIKSRPRPAKRSKLGTGRPTLERH